MFVKCRRTRRHQYMWLMAACCSVVTVWRIFREQRNNHLVSEVKLDINESFTIPRERARDFSNFHYLLNHPDKCADQDVLLLVFVKTSPQNTERRNTIRSTWGNETYILNALRATVKVLFALGSVQTNVGLQERLLQEDRLHSDLIQQDFLDSFHNLTLKIILQFHWTHRHCAHARFLLSTDDDIFVHMPNLVGYLQDLSARGVADFWVGRVHRWSPPIREKSSKYYVPFEMYKWSSYPDYTSGGGYVMSSDVADKIYQATLTLNASLHIDDAFVGVCANAVGVSPWEHGYFSGKGKVPDHQCIYSRMMTAHDHVEDAQHLWEAATHPQVKRLTSGRFGALYCAAVKLALLCRPFYFNTYPCWAAFL